MAESNSDMKSILDQGCSLCGIKGIYACPGHPLPPMTEEEQKALRKVFEEFEDMFAQTN